MTIMFSRRATKYIAGDFVVSDERGNEMYRMTESEVVRALDAAKVREFATLCHTDIRERILRMVSIGDVLATIHWIETEFEMSNINAREFIRAVVSRDRLSDLDL